jgi:hypothetical protein
MTEQHAMTIEINLSRQQLHAAAARSLQAKKPRTTLMFSIIFLLIVAGTMSGLIALVTMKSLQNQLINGNVMSSRSYLSPGLLEAIGYTTRLKRPDPAIEKRNAYVFPTLDTLFFLVLLTAMLPVLILWIVLGLRRTSQIVGHTLRIGYGAEGLTLQRGHSVIRHPWPGIESVLFVPESPAVERALVIGLEFGFVHVWPQASFPDEHVFLQTGHAISALFLASRAAPVPTSLA